MRKFLTLSVLVSSLVLGGCVERIATGEVGIRVDINKQVLGTELMPGSWNQTIVGRVMTFPTKDITINLENKNPMTSDNAALADFDLTMVYAINPTSVAELFSTKAAAFHAYDEKSQDTFLMYQFMQTTVNNAAYKAVRGYKSLEVADNRAKIEAEIIGIVTESLKTEKLDSALTLTMVQIRSIIPNKDILDAATAYVKSVNELKVKENEVKLAKLEAERMQALANQGTQSIEYMKASAMVAIAEGVKNGKVQTILIPHGMTMMNVGK